MNKLLDVYNQMVKEAEEAGIADEQVAEITKYATAADQLLAVEYGSDYEEADVEKLAAMMLEHDQNLEADEEKVAEWDAAGRIMARAFVSELNTDA